MGEKNESEAQTTDVLDEYAGVYIDSSAFAKLYVPEPESDALDKYLQGRHDLIISELTVTEVISAVARRKRERVLNSKQAREVRDAVLSDMRSGSFRCLGTSPAIHREAERILLSIDSVPLRTLDALHITLAISGSATRVVTFDGRLGEAAALLGLEVVQLS
jgi:predicted nucleic acid-binding protein